MLCFSKHTEPERERLNVGTDEEISVEGFEKDPRQLAIAVLLVVLSGGVLLMLLTWRPSIKLRLTQRSCSLETATTVLCTDIYGQEWEEEVGGKDSPTAHNSGIENTPLQAIGGSTRYFINKYIKYVWDHETYQFTRLRSKETSASLHSIYYSRHGLTGTEALRLLQLHGENFIKIEVPSVLQMLLTQISNPFYVFQVYTFILWTAQSYYIYALCIVFLSLLSIASSVYETRKQSHTLRKTMTSQSEVYVFRNNCKMLVSSRNVVPGDVVVLEPGVVLEVDMVVVDGAVVVTEALLTGESVPITKVGVSQNSHLEQLLDQQLHKRHLLYSGSELLQLRGSSPMLGVVINTGYSTSRGELVRSIIFPKPIAFHLYSDFLKLFGLFVVLGFAAMGWSIHLWLNSEPPATWAEVILNSVDLLTFVVPPILPATMTAINVWAQRRLKAQNIFCLSSNYVSLAGPVDVVCFDKTGTLTQDALEVAGVIACSEKGRLCNPVEDLGKLASEHHLLQVALASCHTLTGRITGRNTFSTDLLGHPMDLMIYKNLNWELSERDDGVINFEYGQATPVLMRPCDGPEAEQLEVAQLKVFPFDSSEQRMTVIAKVKGSSQLLVLIKGAPEILVQKCDPESVPDNFEEVLTWYSLQGLRVLGLAGADRGDSWYQMEKTSRDALESGARFLGLVLFHNPLKPETPQALRVLQHADLRTVMITGDNLATAISVARSCGLVGADQQMVIVRAQVRAESGAARYLKVTYHQTITSSASQSAQRNDTSRNSQGENHSLLEAGLEQNCALVMDGHAWQLVREYDRKLLVRLVHKGRVFARMKPDQKVQVIEELRDLGHQVAMCGDGCNDCGALKAAHVGVALSTTEASVAAPFTSTSGGIDCVEKLIREGRATLISTYASFKYNISYGFASCLIVLIHFTIQTEPSDMQYLMMDLVLITVPSLVLGNTAAPDFLVADRPTRRILHPLHITSILSFLGLQALAYWLCWFYTAKQPWFEPFTFISGLYPATPSYQNTALVIFSYYTFIIAAITFSHSLPFRKPFYTNYILSVYLLVSTLFVVVFTFYSSDWFCRVFNLRPLPHVGFRWLLLTGAVVNLLVCYIWERFILYGVIADRFLPWLDKFLPPRQPHEKLEKELQQDQDWPPAVGDLSTRSSINSSTGKTEVKSITYGDEGSDEETDTQVLMMRKLSRRGRFKATVKYTADAAPRVKPKHIIMEETGDQAPVPNTGTFHMITPQPQDWNNPLQTVLQVQDWDAEHSAHLDSPTETYQIPQVVAREEEESHEDPGQQSNVFFASYKPSEESIHHIAASANAPVLSDDSEAGRAEHPVPDLAVSENASVLSDDTEAGRAEHPVPDLAVSENASMLSDDTEAGRAERLLPYEAGVTGQQTKESNVE